MNKSGLHLRRRCERRRSARARQDDRRRQGRQPRRDGRDRPAGAAGLHHHDRGMRALSRRWRRLLGRAARRGRRRRSPISSRAIGKKFGDAGRSAAGLGPLRRARLDAGHDGHGAQPRPQRRDGRGPCRRPRAIARFAWDSYRRFIQMYADVVLGVDHDLFEDALEIAKEDNGVYARHRADRRRLAGAGRATTRRSSSDELGQPFPQDRARAALGRDRARCSTRWDSDRAKVYRRLNDIPGDWGTAVNVQAMVFGNMGDTSRHRRRLHPRSRRPARTPSTASG